VTGIAGVPVRYLNVTLEENSSRFPFVDREHRSGNFAPYSAAWNLELERELSRWLLVRVKYLQSSANGLITLSSGVFGEQKALVLGSAGGAQTRQYEFVSRIGANSLRQFFFSYVRQHASGNLNDASSYVGNFPFPVVGGNLTGSLPNEIPNRFLLWGAYSLPHKIQLNPHVEFRNGFPYQPVNVLQQNLSLGSSAQSRFPRYFSFDLSISKDIQITKKHAIRLTVPMLNLTNHFNPLEVHSNIADPQYGTFFGNYQRHVLVDFDVLN
jgi:hypothetical protein